MIHIVFHEADKEVLQKSFDSESENQEEILVIKDQYELGPVGNFFNEEAEAKRKLWWENLKSGNEHFFRNEIQEYSDRDTVKEIINRLEENEDEVLWIWAAQNSHDVCGYYQLISVLKEFQGRVFILYLNNLPFINEKKLIFYPDFLRQILPGEFKKARKLNRPVTLSEFETDPDEWEKLIKEEKGIRILEGGKKLQQYDYDYFDKEILGLIGTDWIKLTKILSQFNSKIKLGNDLYFLWRIRVMIQEGVLDVQGDNKSLKDCEIKKAQKILSSES